MNPNLTSQQIQPIIFNSQMLELVVRESTNLQLFTLTAFRKIMIILLNHRFCPESSFVCLLSNEKHKPAVYWGSFQNISSINQETAPSLFPSRRFLLRFTFHPLKLDKLDHFTKAVLSSLIY